MLFRSNLHWELSEGQTSVLAGDISIPENAFGLVQLGTAEILLPENKNAVIYTLTLSVPGTKMKNSYELYS